MVFKLSARMDSNNTPRTRRAWRGAHRHVEGGRHGAVGAGNRNRQPARRTAPIPPNHKNHMQVFNCFSYLFMVQPARRTAAIPPNQDTHARTRCLTRLYILVCLRN